MFEELKALFEQFKKANDEELAQIKAKALRYSAFALSAADRPG